MSLSLLSLSFSLFLSIAATAADPLFHSCNSTAANSSSAAATANLNRLTSLLSTTAPPIGFGLGSVGRGADRTYGLALCRGDVERSACRTCIRGAGARIRRLCPRKKDAVVWFDDCLLRYSDAEFFGEADDEHGFFVRRSAGNATSSSSSAVGGAEVVRMMNWLRRKAYLSPLLFATRAVGKLYGLAQCSRDLSGGDCNRCLGKAIAELAGCCGGKTGARVVGRSCYVRYELYPFFRS